MVSYHVFYQLMLLGLLWLFLMLHVVWPSARPAQKQRTTQPITPPHKRSKEPRLSAGLTDKPFESFDPMSSAALKTHNQSNVKHR